MYTNSNKNILINIVYSNKMSTQNDQNKRLVEQKYRKFKAAQLQQIQSRSPSSIKSALTKVDQNQAQKDERERAPDSFAHLIKTKPQNDKIFQVMLADPNINEISEMLKKEAEQKNMQTLISSFPERYRNLLEIEAKFKVVQKYGRERQDKYIREIENLLEKLAKSQQRVKQQQNIINEQHQLSRIAEQRKYEELSLDNRKKELEIVDLKDMIERSQRKCSKLKQDYRNSNEVILELRDQQQQLQKQAQRLIQKLRQCEQKLIKSHKRLLQYDNEKRLQQQNITAQYEQKINELKQQKLQVEQLLEQANIRVEYKQSLLKMSEEESQKTIIKLEEQVKRKYDELQQLRENHLEALKTIDELEERVNCQEEEKVKNQQVWVLEREELKKQLEKSHQSNGNLKAELDVKSELVKMLEKSIEFLKSSFDNDLTQKTNDWLETNRELARTRKQYLAASSNLSEEQQKNQVLQQKLLELKKQLEAKSEAALLDAQKIQMAEMALRKYLEKVIEQEERYCQLKLEFNQWMLITNREKKEKRLHQNFSASEEQLLKKIEKYENLISKLKSQIISLSSEAKSNNSRGLKIVQDLIDQNRQLKKLAEKPSTCISLFSPGSD